MQGWGELEPSTHIQPNPWVQPAHSPAHLCLGHLLKGNFSRDPWFVQAVASGQLTATTALSAPPTPGQVQILPKLLRSGMIAPKMTTF